MVNREIIDEIITKSIYVTIKCSLKDKLRSFQRNRDKYHVEDISIEPIEITSTLIITDEEDIKHMKHIESDEYGTYGRLEMHQDELQKRVNYTPEEFGSVNNYGAYEYKLVNGYFYDTPYYNQRKSDNPSIDDWVDMRIKNLDSAIEKSPSLDIDTTFFRYGYFPKGMKVGETGKFKGYTSLTYQEQTAERFKNGYDGKEEGRYKIVVRTPKGTKGVLLNDTFDAMHEHEFLLGRNQKFMVLSVNDETREVEIGLY